MTIRRPFNLKKWITDNRDLLKPPVGNKNLYADAGDYIVMIVGGPNSRKDFHLNETEELFYQIEGDINVRIQEDGNPVDIAIKEGDMFLLPANVPHRPERSLGSVDSGIAIPVTTSCMNIASTSKTLKKIFFRASANSMAPQNCARAKSVALSWKPILVLYRA